MTEIVIKAYLKPEFIQFLPFDTYTLYAKNYITGEVLTKQELIEKADKKANYILGFKEVRAVTVKNCI